MDAEGSSRLFTPDERRIVHFTGFAHAATHYIELTYPTLAVGLAAEMGLPLEQVLSWSFTSYLLFGLGALPAGVAADRFGPRRVILLGLLAAGASACAAALARPGVALGICLAGVGLGASLYHPAGMGLLSRAVRARGRALGINGIYGNIGIAMAPLTTAALVDTVGWRLTFGLTGGVIMAGALVFSRLRIEEPPPIPPEAQGETEHDGSPRRLVAAFMVLCFTATLGGFAYRANTVAQPALFAENVHFIGYGVAASLAMLVGIAGQYLGGVIADHRELRTSYLLFHLASLAPLVMVSMTMGPSLVFFSGLYVFFALGMQPIENSLFATLTPERWRSTAYGLKFVLTFGVGATAVWMVRWIAPRWEWSGVYEVLVVVVSLLVLGTFVLLGLTRGDASPPDAEPNR